MDQSEIDRLHEGVKDCDIVGATLQADGFGVNVPLERSAQILAQWEKCITEGLDSVEITGAFVDEMREALRKKALRAAQEAWHAAGFRLRYGNKDKE